MGLQMQNTYIMKLKFFLLLLSIHLGMFAHNGKNMITGKVVDAKTNEPLALVNVTVTDLKTGTSTDFEGEFVLKLPDGKYKIEFKTLGYQPVEKVVEIQGGKTMQLKVEMQESQQELDEVVVHVANRKNTEHSVLALQKKSLAIVDGLSAQSFRTSGMSNLASAVKKVVGVNVQNGKYVYVRGLGDRYTKTILNKVDIPGLDPDRNTIQMDLFPTSILENVLVYKSFTADLPADFTGGVVNLVTKDFPACKEQSLSFGTGYNPQMNGQTQFLSYRGGKLDFLAIDDGTYSIPLSINEKIPYTFEHDSKLTEITKKFQPQMGTVSQTDLPNFNFSYYLGDRFDVGQKGNSLGYIANISYRTDYKLYDNYQQNYYQKDNDKTVYPLKTSKLQNGSLGITNVILNALAGVTYKTKNTKYKFNLLHIRNGEKNAGLFTQIYNESDFVTFKTHYLAYTQRQITNALLTGIHTAPKKKFKTSWKLAVTKSGIYDKDVRSTPYQFENNTYSIAPNNKPKRIWRYLDEMDYVAKIDFEKKMSKHHGKWQFGLISSYKNRDYKIYNYEIGIKGNINLQGNGNELLSQDNIWTPQTDRGTYIVNGSVYNKSNLYNASQINGGAYVSTQYYFNDKLKTSAGLRLEKFMLLYTGQNTTGSLKYDNDVVIDKLDVFPSLNFTYSINEQTNLRLSYARTTARPSFKESSIAEIFDPLSNMTFIGNIHLKPTYIQNIDVRYEIYSHKTDLFAVSPFYKYFTDPIELTFYQAAPSNFTPKNLGTAQVYGIELEWRKNLQFIHSKLKHFKFSTNVSVIQSKMQMYDDEYQLRLNTARQGEKVSHFRPLQGQAPYLINAGLTYENKKNAWMGNISYNTQGKTLERVGGGIPDVYSRPFNSLNINLKKTIGQRKRASISLKINNLLNENKVFEYESFQAQPAVYSFKSPGRTFWLKYSVRF